MNEKKEFIEKEAIFVFAINISKDAKVGLIKILQSIDNESNTYFSLRSGGHIGGRSIKGFDELERFFEVLESEVNRITLKSFDVDLQEFFISTIRSVIFYAELFLSRQLNSVSILEELGAKIQEIDVLINKLEELAKRFC